jgi:hypothetical protein
MLLLLSLTCVLPQRGTEVSAACAVVDQLTLASAAVFLHVYNAEPRACPGAGSGSCFGQWVLRHREWKHRPSYSLAGASEILKTTAQHEHSTKELRSKGNRTKI